MSLTCRTRTGLLQLHFGVRHGQTVLLSDLQKTPLMVVRPFRLACGTLMVYIINPTGGVLGGDHSEIRVQVDGGARALLLTQAATRIQPDHTGAAATQDIHFTVAAGGRLEYYPERTIPFARSRFVQTLRADLEGGAEFGWLETLATGRVLSGERLEFDEYHSAGEVCVDGGRVYLDRQRLLPDSHSRAPGILGTADYVATGVWVAPPPEPPLTAEAEAALAPVTWGHTHAGAVWLRHTAEHGLALDKQLLPARAALRQWLWNAAPLEIRG